MEKKTSYYIIILRSYNQSTFLYKRMINKGCQVELISTPCKLDAGCSQCIRFEEVDKQCVKEEIKNTKMDIKGIYKVIWEKD